MSPNEVRKIKLQPILQAFFNGLISKELASTLIDAEFKGYKESINRYRDQFL